jgi:WD40 repeat protein
MRFILQASNLPIWSIAPDPGGTRLAVSGKSDRIPIVDLDRQVLARILKGHEDGVPFVRFADERTLISASDDATLRVWDLEKGTERARIPAHQSLINAFALTRDRRFLVSVSSDRQIRVWSYPALTLHADLGPIPSAGAAVTFAADTDDELLVTDWQGRAYLLRGTPPDWEIVEQRQICDGPLYMASPRLDGWWAVSPGGSAPGLWFLPAESLEDARRIGEEPALYCHSSRDGTLTAVSYTTRIELWDNRREEVVRRYAHAWDEGFAVAIVEAAGLIVQGSAAGHIIAWELDSGP